jgi:hypothetical protein
MDLQAFPNSNSPDQKLKSYWNRPGGKFGVIIGIGLIALLVYYVFPILTVMVWDVFHLGVALVSLGVFLYIVTNRKLRLSLFYLWEILMKWLVGAVIQLDPFIIAEDYINDMQKSREKLYEQSVEVDAQKEKIEMKIKEKADEQKKLLARAKAAEANDMKPEFVNATRQIARIDEYNKQLSPIRDNLAKIGDYLTKVHKNSGYLIEDAKNELELKKDLYKSVTSGNRALVSAMKIFNGDPEKKLMVEQSMEYLKDDIASKLANMKKAINYSADFMRSIDLDNATYEVQGLKMLESYNPDTEFQLSGKGTGGSSVKSELGKVNTSSYNDLLS